MTAEAPATLEAFSRVLSNANLREHIEEEREEERKRCVKEGLNRTLQDIDMELNSVTKAKSELLTSFEIIRTLKTILDEDELKKRTVQLAKRDKHIATREQHLLDRHDRISEQLRQL